MQNKKTFIIITVIILFAAMFTITRIAIISKGSIKEVDLARAEKKDLIQSIAVTGNIEANNKEDIIVSNMQKVTEITVSEGQQVKAGEIIAKLDTTDLKYQLKKAQINYEITKLNLDTAKGNLSDLNTDNKPQIDQLNTQVKQLSKQLESAKADIENINTKLDSCEIRASIGGKIIKLSIKENQYPTQQNNIISIYDLSQCKVTVNVSQYDAIQINKGQRTRIKIKGLDNTYEGTVTYIGEAAELSYTGANQEAKIKVEIAISNPDDKIKAGYEADVDIILTETKDAVTISFEALEKDKEGKSFIYTVQNGKAVKRYIKQGTETEFDIQVLDGLKENETYIKNPPAALKEGDKVRAAGGK